MGVRNDLVHSKKSVSSMLKQNPRAAGIIAAVVVILVILLIYAIVSDLGSGEKKESTASVMSESFSSEQSVPVDSEQQGSSVPENVDHEGSLKGLKQTIEDKFETFTGTWSCCFKNLETNEWFEINNHNVYPASMIKLFALAACYQQIEDGLIKEDDVYDVLYNMAANSSNQSFNEIVHTIGTSYINKWCSENGCPNTKQYHGLQPSTNYEGLQTTNMPNQTCAVDVAHVLEGIYRKECVSAYASEQMLDILFHQYYRGKIPAAIPYPGECANKTGDTYDVSHDAAIIYSPGADYILVIMGEIPDISFEQNYRFIDISRTVYEYFNPGAYDNY